MADYSNADILAAWLVHASRAGADGRLIPTEAETVEIVETKAGRFHEAHAMGTAFVKRVVETEPRGLVESTMGALSEFIKLQKKFGGVFSAPPPPVKRLGRGSR